MVALRSGRLDLRFVAGTDVGFVESLYASADVTRTLLRIQRPISRQEARELCTAPSAESGEHRFVGVLRASDQPIGAGTVRAHAARGGMASIGYSILPAFWRQGIGTELARLLVEFSFGTLGAVEVRATTLHDNIASARVLEKLGFATLDEAARETDSRGAERRVIRWRLRREVRS
jgi:RimJ/RimL family protein N-acetyltransferase